MTTLFSIITFCAMLTLIFSVIWLVINWFRKLPLRKSIITLVTSFIILIIGGTIIGNADAPSSSTSNAVSSSQTVHKKSTSESEKENSILKESRAESKKEQRAQEKAESIKALHEKQAEEKARAASAKAKEESRAAKTESKKQSDDTDKLYTADQGDIIGNSNSKIYHVPGQAGYHMNSANAVHFKSEAEAQASGYRKSLR